MNCQNSLHTYKLYKVKYTRVVLLYLCQLSVVNSFSLISIIFYHDSSFCTALHCICAVLCCCMICMFMDPYYFNAVKIPIKTTPIKIVVVVVPLSSPDVHSTSFLSIGDPK